MNLSEERHISPGLTSLSVGALLLAILCALLYANSLDGEFQFDDQTSIIENESLRTGRVIDWWSYWPTRAVSYTSIGLDYRRHGLSPRGYHVTNVLIHGAATMACAWLLWLLLAGSTPRTRATAALLGAALFAAHPLQTQAVAYIIQRASSLNALFYLSCCAFYLAAGMSRRRNLVLVAWLCGLLAMLSKESALSLPFGLMLIDFTALRRAPGRLQRVAPFVLLALLPPILVQAQSFGNDTAGLTGQASEVGRWQYLWTQTEIVLRYARLVVWPSGQSIDHEVTWRAVPWSGLAPLALAVHACVLASAAVLWRQSHRLAALPIVWLYVTLAPESSLYPIDDAMFEHRMYLPLFGVSLAFALLLQRILTRRAALGVALALIIIAALSMTTVRRNLVWNTQESLWADALMKAPDKARPNMAVGWLAGNRGELELARRHLLRAVEIDDDYAMAWNNLGVVADRSGDSELAVRAYSEASRLYPNESILHSNRAAALRRLGRLDESEAAFLRALELDGGNRSARAGLAALREQRE